MIRNDQGCLKKSHPSVGWLFNVTDTFGFKDMDFKQDRLNGAKRSWY